MFSLTDLIIACLVALIFHEIFNYIVKAHKAHKRDREGKEGKD